MEALTNRGGKIVLDRPERRDDRGYSGGKESLCQAKLTLRRPSSAACRGTGGEDHDAQIRE